MIKEGKSPGSIVRVNIDCILLVSVIVSVVIPAIVSLNGSIFTEVPVPLSEEKSPVPDHTWVSASGESTVTPIASVVAARIKVTPVKAGAKKVLELDEAEASTMLTENTRLVWAEGANGSFTVIVIESAPMTAGAV